MLPDEIISEILSPALKVSEDLFSDVSDVSPFSDYNPSTSAYLLVCKDWLRVATPLLYNVVVLRSRSQANALETVLRSNRELGYFIKKLRVEGGYGLAMHTILKSAPNVTDLVLSFSIWSSDGTEGLCKGLRLIDPHRVIVLDPYMGKVRLKNKQLAALKRTLFACLRVWKNLQIFGYPYGSSIRDDGEWVKKALELSQLLAETHVHTVVLSSSFTWIHAFITLLCNITSLKVLQFQRPFEKYYDFLALLINSHPPLKKLAKYTRFNNPETVAVFSEPDVSPSLNPFFVPMESASEETREAVWKRVLFFAMYVEELRSPSFSYRPSESYPSRLPILRVSKYFYRLGLPYLYDCPRLGFYSANGIENQLEQKPYLGSFIRRIFTMEDNYRINGNGTVLSLFRHATNLEVFIPQNKCRLQRLTVESLELLGKTAGHSMQELSANVNYGRISASLFENFTALRVLDIGRYEGPAEKPESPSDALKTLHTLRIHSSDPYDGLLFDFFAEMRLKSLRTLVLPLTCGSRAQPSLTRLIRVHSEKLLHLTTGRVDGFQALNFCPNLLDIELLNECNLKRLTPDAPHNSLVRIVANNLTEDLEKVEVDLEMFPALREIQLRDIEWPRTEREISRSAAVRLAESLFLKNVKLLNSEGKQWIPRLKTARTRK